MDDQTFLIVENLSKSFGNEQVLKNISFTLEKNALMAILGRSGSGKTTLLKCLAGLDSPGFGDVLLSEQPINKLPPQSRGVVYLFQEPLLFPHLNVYENLAFGLRLRKTTDSVIKKEVGEMLAQLDLTDHAKKAPHQLSGGQRQRVSFGRALMIKPRLLLLDEPFASLDVDLKAQMQALFLKLARSYDITSIWVTHDLKEALIMGTSFGFMQNGHLRLYASGIDFVADTQTGVQSEIIFWKGILDQEK
ncbi:MAG: ABC transporter ATP-binding protein [Rhodothermia bacterium]|nr:ABC transporter ATP-binding protein [Rhodothermia bacterium]